MYYLTDVSNYEPEFSYTDIVIVSAGTNDLTRKRLLPEQICDIIVPFFKNVSAKYPNTRFIVSSTILTSSTRQNSFIVKLDRYIEDSVHEFPNFHFLNSHKNKGDFKDNKVYINTVKVPYFASQPNFRYFWFICYHGTLMCYGNFISIVKTLKCLVKPMER